MRWWRLYRDHSSWVIACSIALLSLAASCAPPAPRFQSEVASVGDVRDVVPAVGLVRPTVEIDVRASRPGRLISINVSPSDHVRSGQLLATVAPGEVPSDLLEARAQLSGLEASLREAEIRAREARRTYEARRGLVERGFYSSGGLVSLQAALEASQTSVEGARAGVGAAAVRVRRIEESLRNFEIRAPIDGIVIARRRDPGEEAGPGDTDALFTITAPFETMQIEAEVSEPDIARISANLVVAFRVDAYPGVRFSGSVKEILPEPTRSGPFVFYRVIVDVENADGKLRPGMTASIEFIQTDVRQVLRVPVKSLYFVPPDYVYQPPEKYRADLRGANIFNPDELAAAETGILLAGGKRRVFIERDGRWQRREVRIGAQSRDYVEIVEGLRAGDRVIVGLQS